MTGAPSQDPVRRTGAPPGIPSRSWRIAEGIVLLALFAGTMVAGTISWFSASVNLQRLQRITDLLEMDPFLMWRQRPDLDTTFEATRVWTDAEGMRLATPPGDPARDRPRGSPEIAVFGASPTFGYGVEGDESWPAQLEARLRPELPGVRVRNAGQIGFSTWQGLRLMEQVIDEWRPDLVVIDYVVNDVEQIRFFFPNGLEDTDTQLPSEFRMRVSNALRFFPPTGILLKAHARLMAWLAGEPSPRWVYEMAAIRVPMDAYEMKLRAMVSMCRERGIRVVFAERAFLLPTVVAGRPADQDVLLGRVEAALEAGETWIALGLIDRALARHPTGPHGHYLRGRILEEMGDEDAARDEYREATASILMRCARTARQYNGILEDVARELKVPVIDPTARMGGDKANMSLYVHGDYIHPNAAGHRIMAECGAGVVLRTLRDGDGPLIEKCEDVAVSP